MKLAVELNDQDRGIPNSTLDAVESLWQFENPISGLPPVPGYSSSITYEEVESVSISHRPSHLSSPFESDLGLKTAVSDVTSQTRTSAVAFAPVSAPPSAPNFTAAIPKNDFGIVKTIISKYSANDLEELLSNCNKKQRLVLLQALLMRDQA